MSDEDTESSEDLTLASTEGLLYELSNRCHTLVVGFIPKGTVGEPVTKYFRTGSLTHQIGLIEVLKDRAITRTRELFNESE
jgi:hypothetical protein